LNSISNISSLLSFINRLIKEGDVLKMGEQNLIKNFDHSDFNKFWLFISYIMSLSILYLLFLLYKYFFFFVFFQLNIIQYLRTLFNINGITKSNSYFLLYLNLNHVPLNILLFRCPFWHVINNWVKLPLASLFHIWSMFY